MSLSLPLVQAFIDHPLGLCGRHEAARSVSSIDDIEQRLNVLTFGVVVDTNFISSGRWSMLVALHDHWLLDPSRVAYGSSTQVLIAMNEMGISAPQHIARVWWQISRGVQGRYRGSWREMLKSNDENAQALQIYLRDNRTTYPVLAGPIISARWLDLVHRIGGVSLRGWEELTVKLPAHQRKTAGLFGIVRDEAHPLLSSALNAWSISCRKLSKEFCALALCPERGQD